jgi:tryptophanyl-tRNA synthetase
VLPQFNNDEVIKTAYLISKHLKDKDFTDAEEDLSSLYKEKKIYEGITFPVKMAILLMVADFMHLHLNDGYKNIMIMLGIEEHLYVRIASILNERMKNDCNFCGMYSKVIKGLSGFPKMSKSIKGSAITTEMKKDDISKIILNEKDVYTDPEESVIYQMMSAVSTFDLNELNEIKNECINKSKIWQDRKVQYIDFLDETNKKWRSANGIEQY